MFAFKGISVSKVFQTAAAAASSISKYLIMKLTGEGYNKDNNKVFLDESNNYFGPITVNGNAGQGSFTPFGTNWSWYFDGTGDYITVPTISISTSQSFCMEAWIFIGSAPAADWMILGGSDDNSAGTTNTQFRVVSGNFLSLYFGGTSIQSSASITPNKWVHVAAVRNSGSFRLYIDGVGNTPVSGSTDGQVRYIGAHGRAGGIVKPLTGYVSNVRVTVGNPVYTGNFTPSAAPLTALSNTVLLTCQNGHLYDNSKSLYSLTPNGDVQSRPFGPFDQTETRALPARSVLFNGTTDYLATAASANLSIASNADWTIEAWVYPTSLATLQCIFFSSGGAADSWITNHNVAVYLSATNGALIIEYSNGSVPLNSTGAVNARINQWNHVALVYNGTAKTITSYMNGVRDFNSLSLSTYAPPSASPRVTIGRTDPVVSTPTYLVSGYISNYRLVRGSQVYSGSTITVPTSPLTAISGTALLTCQSNVFADSSTNNFTITAAGTPRVTANTPFSLSTTTSSLTAVSQSWSANLDGTGDYLTAASNAVFGYGTGDFTIEFWLYMPSLPTQDVTIVSNLSLASATNPHIYCKTADKRIYYYTAGADRIVGDALIAGTWYHIALSRSSGSTRLFINGTQSGSTYSDTNNYGSTAPLGIGTYWSGASPVTTNTMSGYISNFRIVKGTGLYTSSFTPPTSDLTAVANTSILTCQSSRFVDNSSNALAITQYGDAKTTMFGPFLSTGSILFDGSSRLNVASNSAFSFGTGDFTIEGWFYLSSASTAYRAIVYIPHASGSIQVRFGDNTSYGTYFQVSMITSAASNVYSTNLTQANLVNQWNHFAFTRSSSICRVFINGVQRNLGTGTTPATFPNATFSDSTNITNNASVQIGDAAASIFWIGNMSNIRVLNGTALYTSNFTPPTANLANITNTSLLLVGQNNLRDTSSNALAVTTTGTPTIVANNNGLPTSPYANNYSVQLSGSNYLSVPSSAGLNLDSSDFTIECWFYPTATPGAGGATLFAKRATTAGYTAVQVTFTNNLTPQLYVSANGSTWGISNPTASVSCTLNSWNHVAVTRFGDNYRLFINGQVSATGTLSGSLMTNSEAFTIGAGAANGGSPMTACYISNFRIIKGTALYTTTFTPPTTNLTAVTGTTLLTGQSNRLIDNSTTAATITGVSSPAIVNAFDPYDNLYSFFFNGSTDYLTSPASNLYAFGTGDFTVEAWVYQTARTSWGQIAGPHLSGTGANWALYIDSSGRLLLYISTGANSSPVTFTSTATVQLYSWSHIAACRSGGTLRLFINGVDAGGSGASTSNVGTTYNMGIGAASNGNGTFFAGYISNLRITKGTGLYTAAFTPSTAPLTTNSSQVVLLTAQGNSYADASGNNVLLTPTSNPRTDPFTPFRNTISTATSTTAGTLLSGSYFFDGVGDYLSIPASTAFLAASNEDYTIEFWWRPTVLPGGAAAAVLSAGWPTVGGSPFLFYYDPLVTPKRLSYYSSSNGSSWDIASNQTIISNPLVNQWYHVAVSRRNGVIRLFSNGSLTTSISNTGAMYSAVTYPVTVGAGAGGGSASTGFVSNLRIIRGAGLYTNSFTPPSIPGQTIGGSALTLNFRAAGIYDSVSDNTFETLGDAAVSVVQKKNGNTSMYFDATGDYLTASNRELAWGTGDFTVEFWMYSADVSSATQRGFMQTSTTAGGLVANYTSGIVIYQGATCSAGGTITSTNGGLAGVLMGTNFGSQTAVLTANTWTHIAVVRASGVVTTYVNGTSVDSRTISTSVTATNIAVGGYYSNAYLLNGYLDDFQIHSGLAKYTSNFTPS